MILIIDHYDSFIDMIADYCKQLGFNILIIKTDEISCEVFTNHPISHIIIGPGPGHPADKSLDATRNILEYAINCKTSLLGICLGHQIIADYFGAKITTAKTISHGKISKCINNSNSKLFKNLPQNFKITRYHSLAIDQSTIPDCTLKITAYTEDNEIMAIEHKTLNIYGIQFHPESITTEYGLQILNNFLR